MSSQNGRAYWIDSSTKPGKRSSRSCCRSMCWFRKAYQRDGGHVLQRRREFGLKSDPVKRVNDSGDPECPAASCGQSNAGLVGIEGRGIGNRMTAPAKLASPSHQASMMLGLSRRRRSSIQAGRAQTFWCQIYLEGPKHVARETYDYRGGLGVHPGDKFGAFEFR